MQDFQKIILLPQIKPNFVWAATSTCILLANVQTSQKLPSMESRNSGAIACSCAKKVWTRENLTTHLVGMLENWKTMDQKS